MKLKEWIRAARVIDIHGFYEVHSPYVRRDGIATAVPEVYEFIPNTTKSAIIKDAGRTNGLRASTRTG
ncbi:MAG: hypothetical protein PVG72_09565 [Gammaproteobacteria bacterium]